MVAQRTISGMSAKMISVSQRLVFARMMKDTTILSAAIKYSSGQWWANSVTSNRSLVMRAISWPILVLSK